MSPQKGWFESEDDYQSRVAQEADERTIENSTGSSSSKGWFESDDNYRERIGQEANEHRIEDSTGSSPSKGWFESSDDYSERIHREANERTIEDSTGSSPSKGWFESDDDYDTRVRREANEQILKDGTGSTPKQGWFEGNHDYRSRIAHEAREARASASSDEQTGDTYSSGSYTSSSSGNDGGPIVIILLLVAGLLVFGSLAGFFQKSTGTVNPYPRDNYGLVHIEGASSYKIDPAEETASIHVHKVDGQFGSGHSGSLRLALYASDRPYGGGTLSGKVLASHTLEPLKWNYYYHDIDRTTNYGERHIKLDGDSVYYITLVLLEYNGDDDYIVSWQNFDQVLILPPKQPWWKFWADKNNNIYTGTTSDQPLNKSL